LLVIREHGETLLDLLKIAPLICGSIDVLTNSPFSTAFARYCFVVNMKALSV